MIKNVVAAIIKNNNNEILIAQKNDGPYSGYWEFPGGKIEENETEEDALKREILEELNLEINVEDYICKIEYNYPTFHLSMRCYYATIKQGEISKNVHSDIRWVNKRELKYVNLLPADIEVMRRIV